MIFETLFKRYPVLITCKSDILKADALIKSCYDHHGKLLICGNGGSCADSQHIVGELMKGFLKRRPLTNIDKQKMRSQSDIKDDLLDGLQYGLPAISLTDFQALSTAFNNDVNSQYTFAQQVFTLGNSNDLLIGISTSGNAVNVANAITVAKSMGISTLGLTGCTGGVLLKNCACTICVPENETFKIQELHLPVYHALCASIEEYYFDK